MHWRHKSYACRPDYLLIRKVRQYALYCSRSRPRPAMSKPERLQLLSDLMLLAVAVVWGTSYGIIKGALVFYPVLGLLMLRFGITFVILSPALRELRHADARTLRGVFLAGMLLLGIFLSETFCV